MLPIKEWIKIEEPSILNDRSLLFKLRFSKRIREYFTSDNLVFQYDRNIDVTNGSILQIPAIASIVTVAWAIGADVYIKKLDRAYLESLNKVRSVMKAWYPQFSYSTEIVVESIDSNRFSNKGYGLLFTGGIDSTVSYIMHRNEKPTLISIWGEGEDIDSYSKESEEKLIDFSRREGVRLNFIRTNVDKVINKRLLYEKFGLNWYMNVYHGIVLTSLCAPLTCVENIKTLLIASSGGREWKYPWGSDPRIDNNISWADVHVTHDGYEMSRQEKIRNVLRPYIENGGSCSHLRVCTKQSKANCGNCGKCLKTIVRLVLEDIDPNECGFSNVSVETFDSIKENLSKCNLIKRKALIEREAKLLNRMGEVHTWKNIQRHIPETINHNLYNSRTFFEWFRSFNVYYCMKRIKISRLPQLLFYSIFDMLAPLNVFLPKIIRNADRKLFDFVVGQ